MNLATAQVQANVTIYALHQTAAVLARASADGQSYCYAGLQANTLGTLTYTPVIYKVVNGVASPLAIGSATLAPSGITTTIRLVVGGQSLQLVLGNNLTPTLSTTDNTLASGSIGIRTVNGATLDNFTAQ